MKFDVDYSKLDNKLSEPRYFRYADVKDRLVKVAFDIVRFKEPADIDGLWQIQQTDDGEVIVATYEESGSPAEVKQSSTQAEISKQASAWDARANRSGTAVTVYYKRCPVTKVATVDYGIPAEDASLVCTYLPEKLANDGTFRESLLEQLSDDERQELFTKFPELNG